MRKVIMLCIVLSCVLSCTDRGDVGDTILPRSVRLRVGDVVFRRGGGFASQAVLMADRGGAYSHTGIVVDSGGQLMVVHAVPGESDFEGDEDRVKMERPEDFFHPLRALQGAVSRPRDSLAARQAAARAVEAYRRGTLFDHRYDDRDTSQLYCTELVVHAYARTVAPLTGVSHHHLHLVGLETDCILPSDLLGCKDLKEVIAF